MSSVAQPGVQKVSIRTDIIGGYTLHKNKYSGYLSEQAKRKFTITAGILGGIFFFAQFIVPFIIMAAHPANGLPESGL